MTKPFLFFLTLTIANVLHAQDFKKRYSFAKSYFGIDAVTAVSNSHSPYLNQQNSIETFSRNPFLTPFINIGATHFWGYADLFVSIGTRNVNFKKDRLPNFTRFGAMTGFRIYPFQLTDRKVRPFIGYKFSPFRYQQETLNGESQIRTKTKSMLEIGLGFRNPRWYGYITYAYVINPDVDIFLSRGISATSSFPGHLIGFGLNRMLETTAGSWSRPAQKLDSILSDRNRYGFFVAAGPSAAFPTQKSSYLTEELPFLDQYSMPSVFPDFSVGYHFSKQDFIASLSFRPMRQYRQAYSYEMEVVRRALSLETYKFLFDYHGFAPFVGVGFGYDFLHLSEKDQGMMISGRSEEKWNPSFIFGWDIRPTRRADFFLLRTNLRYSPWLEIAQNSKAISLQYLEFNFIQLVVYPQRFKAMRAL